MSNQDIFEAFCDISLQRRYAQKKGDTAKANLLFDELTELKRTIYSLPDKGMGGLLELLGNDEGEIRLNAAIALIPLDEQVALNGLELLSKSKDGELAFTAQMTVRQLALGEAEFLKRVL